MKVQEIIKKVTAGDSDYALVRQSKFFDAKWYKKNYDVRGDAARHYLMYGAQSGYNPGPEFSRIKYELIYEDVRYVKANPLVHYERYGCYENNFTDKIYICDKEMQKIDVVKKRQDERIAQKYDPNLENLIVFLVPEVDMVGGGVMSINSIAKVTKSLKKIHHSEVMICTMPNPKTFDEYTKFESDFDVYRFDQLMGYFKNLKNLMIHIPETYVYSFLYFIKPDQQCWLQKIKNTQINILNQNVDLLPRPRQVDYLKELVSKVTMTCGHKKYCVPQFRTSYDIDVHLFSTSNFTKYEYVPYEKKENLLVYSPDFHPKKEQILEKIKTEFPELEMKEIRDMSYEEYLETIGRAKWMITFGEGLDGYFSESIRSGTMAFSVYNLSFFDENYDGLKNIFEGYAQMQAKITDFMKEHDEAKKYKKVVDACRKIDEAVYNDEEYVENIRQFYLENYTLPLAEVQAEREKRIAKKPLISVAMATYNGAKYLDEQIQSILNQDYPNLEVVVSDDGSTDGTLEILNKYRDRIKVIHNKGEHGLLGNFSNALKNCKGEYIALSDQDDIWEADKLTLLLERIDEFDIVHAGVCVIDGKGDYHPWKEMHIAYEIDKTIKYRIQDNVIESMLLGCTSLMRADFVKKYSRNIPKEMIYHDLWLSYNAMVNGRGMAFVDQQLVRYRQHGHNTAFLTYNSDSWKDKKVRMDQYMINKFPNLDNRVKRLFALDIDFVIMKSVLRKYFPNALDYFVNENFYNLDVQSLTEACEQMRADIKKYKLLA